MIDLSRRRAVRLSLAMIAGLASAHIALAASGYAPTDSSALKARLSLPTQFAPVRLPMPGVARPAASTTIDDGTWNIIVPPLPNPSTPSQHVGVFDSGHGRMIVHGGYGLVSDTWSLDLTSLTWTQIPATNPPPQRWGACAIYDPVGDQLVMFGGYSNGQYSSDLWVLPLHGPPTWTMVAASGPSPRLFASAIYDQVRGRMIVFGGEAGASFSDAWALTLATMTWAPMTPLPGSLPDARFGHSAVYDPVDDEMLIYGGSTAPTTGVGGPQAPDDVWALTLGATTAWNKLGVQGLATPGGRSYHTAIVDVHLGRMIIHGGYTDHGLSDTWALTLGSNPSWALMNPAGPTAPARWLHSAIYDQPNFRMVVFGGSGTGDLRSLNFVPTSQNPAITSLDPPYGAPGDNIVIRGFFPETPLMVEFNGVTANIVSSNISAIQATVPVGVTTGPVTAVFPSGSIMSPADFTVVQVPVVTNVQPSAAFIGDLVSITGQHLTGANRVAFGSASHASFTVVSDVQITANVDAAAVTGPVSVFNEIGSATSPTDFTVLRNLPVITTVSPATGPVGIAVTITGQYFTTANKVSFGPSSSAQFTIISDTEIRATVDPSAVTGPITITNRDGTATSTFSFTVRLPAYPPSFVAVLDAPNDQGGKVILEWLASDYDIGLGNVVTRYRIWRRAPLFGSHAAPAAAVAGASGASATHRALGFALGFLGAAAPLDGAPAGFWESIGEIPAARIPGYAFTAPTLQDSLPDSNPYTAFIIQSLTSDPTQLYFSDPDSGYSVDNLPPPTPVPFAATYGRDSNVLHWTTSRAPDLQEFRLYRGIALDFTPSSSNLVTATRDTNFTDTPGSYFYKLAAVDIHGNVSRYAEVSPDQPVATLASLVSEIELPDRVILTWYLSNRGSPVNVYRRTLTTDWVLMDSRYPDGLGYVRYEDASVVVGTNYGYRLGIMDAGTEVFAGEVWATAGTPQLALSGILPNPAVNGRITVSFALPSDGEASLELIDIAGRRVARREVGSLGPGRHRVALDGGGRLAPGVYLVRLMHAQGTLKTRAVVIN